MAFKLEGGKALMDWPLAEEIFFCGFPNFEKGELAALVMNQFLIIN